MALSEYREKGRIERFHSRDQHLCKFIETKGSVYIRKEFNSYRICLVHQHGRRFIDLEHQYGRRDVMWKRFIFALDLYWYGNVNKRSYTFQFFKAKKIKENDCTLMRTILYRDDYSHSLSSHLISWKNFQTLQHLLQLYCPVLQGISLRWGGEEGGEASLTCNILNSVNLPKS